MWQKLFVSNFLQMFRNSSDFFLAYKVVAYQLLNYQEFFQIVQKFADSSNGCLVVAIFYGCSQTVRIVAFRRKLFKCLQFFTDVPVNCSACCDLSKIPEKLSLIFQEFTQIVQQVYECSQTVRIVAMCRNALIFLGFFRIFPIIPVRENS